MKHIINQDILHIENNIKPSNIVTNEKKHLWFFMIFYTMIISISNWYDARLISLFSFTVSPGALTFPLSFLISDVITEVYGYKNARKCIWVALFFNILFILFGEIITRLPSPSFAIENNNAFDKLLSINAWVVAGSFISYLASEPLNAYLIAKLKIFFKGKYIGIRFVFSTIIAACLDSIIFIGIAFFTILNFENLIKLMFTVWLIKSVIEIIGLPFSIRLAIWLKNNENLDIFDNHTNFNFFNLNNVYEASDNHYHKGEV